MHSQTECFLCQRESTESQSLVFRQGGGIVTCDDYVGCARLAGIVTSDAAYARLLDNDEKAAEARNEVNRVDAIAAEAERGSGGPRTLESIRASAWAKIRQEEADAIKAEADILSELHHVLLWHVEALVELEVRKAYESGEGETR